MTATATSWFDRPARLALIPLAVSGALLLGALGFQFIGKLPPCALCVDQRYAHVAALILAVVAIIVRGRIGWILVGLAVLALAVSGGIGIFHAGVEQKWWAGPTGCTGGSLADLTPEEATKRLMGTPVVRCDEIPWALFGLSMAAWNAIVSLGVALLASMLLLRRRKA
ncbi:MAG: disulfide bond formation protein B [Rhodospirillales bacterium]